MGVTEPTLRIGLLWHSVNSGNHGVGALTVGNRALASAAADRAGVTPLFTVIAPLDAGPRTVDLASDQLFPITRRTIFGKQYLHLLGQLDVVLDIGAGDSFADIYGAKRFAFIWTTKMLALARGVPLVLSPQTIGPFQKQPYTALAAAVMRRAELIVARDPLSHEVARRMAPAVPQLMTSDVAFRLPFTQRATPPGGKTQIGINVSGLLWNHHPVSGNRFGLTYDYRDAVEQLLIRLSSRGDVTVHLFTHVADRSNPIDDDSKLADALALRFPDVKRVPDFPSPSTAKSWISGLDFVVSARMHACIAAYSTGVPVVPMAYSRKFAGLFEGLLNYPHVLPTSGIDTDGAVSFVLDRVENLPTLAKDLIEGNDRSGAMLDRYEEMLADLFSALARKRGK